MLTGSWAKVLAQTVLSHIPVTLCPGGHCCLPRLHLCSHLLPSALPFPHGPVEGDLWDRLIVGSRVCPGLLVPEVVSGGTCRPCGEREALS